MAEGRYLVHDGSTGITLSRHATAEEATAAANALEAERGLLFCKYLCILRKGHTDADN